MDRRRDVEEAARAGPSGGEAERDEPHRDQGESKRKSEAGKTEAVAAAREIGAVGAGGCGVWSCGGHGGRLLLVRAHDLGLGPRLLAFAFGCARNRNLRLGL